MERFVEDGSAVDQSTYRWRKALVGEEGSTSVDDAKILGIWLPLVSVKAIWFS